MLGLAAVVTLALAASAAAPVEVVSLLELDEGDGAAAIRLRQRAGAWEALREASGTLLIPGVPIGRGGDETVTLRVRRFAVTTPATRFVLGRPGGGDRPLDFDPASLVLLRGRVEGAPQSSVYLAVTSGAVRGWIARVPGGPVTVVGPAPDGSLRAAETAGFGAPLPVEVCGVETAGAQRAPASGGVAGTTPPTELRSLQLAIETDHEYFQIFGDESAAAAYVTMLYGAVSDLYLRDAGCAITLSFVRIWDAPDELYDAPDPLDDFRQVWNASMKLVPRDAAQLLTGRRNLPYGGVAYLSATCGESAYSVAGYMLGAFADPMLPHAGNWDLVVTAHELGHNCGTLHTHDYGIDECADGDVQRGTIMSYCHTTSGGNANIDMRFHRLVQQEIAGFLAGRSCVVVDCNGNGVADAVDIAQLGGSPDANDNGVPDECEDCDDDGILDPAEIAGGAADANGNGVPDACEADCNGNGLPDDLDLVLGSSFDLYGNGVPDECEPDCNRNGVADYNEIQADMTLDLDRDAVLDACQDCDGDGVSDVEALGGGLNVWAASLLDPAARELHGRSGVFVGASAALGLQGPHDLLIVGDRALISSSGDDRIARFDLASGASLGDLVSGGDLDAPASMVVRPGGTLLVASEGNDRVLEYDVESGAFLGAFVAPGSGGLTGPFGLAFGPSGDLYVSGADDSVRRYDGATGAFISLFVAPGSGGLSVPRSLLFTPAGNLLVASFDSDAVLEYDGTSGAFLGQFDRGGLDSGFWGLENPWSLRLHPRGDVILVSSHGGNAAVHSYDATTGLFMRTWYILAQDIFAPTGIDIAPPSRLDCTMNFRPDACDIADGTSTDANGDGVPDECQTAPCSADVTADGAVNVDDLVAVIVAWGPCAACAADIDDDGDVDVDDLVAVIVDWGCG